MIVRNENQALCVAVEMERRAIGIYERALLLAHSEEVREGIREILADEREHLRSFTALRESCALDEAEERMLLKAMAAQVLFPGGVMEMEREQGLSSLKGLYAFAAESEKEAMETYRDFSRRCSRENTARAFLSIAREESLHLAELKRRLEDAAE